MIAFWCELAWLGGPDVRADVLIEVVGGRIERVHAGVAGPPPGAERLRGLVIPGLANAHSHAFQRALRGRTQRARGSFWTWREQMYALARALDPDSALALARATFAEMALAGVTLVGEFHYVHHGPGGVPYAEPNAMGEALIQAASEAGIRITLLDACYLRGGIGVEPDEVQRRFCDAGVDEWAVRVDDLASSVASAGGAGRYGDGRAGAGDGRAGAGDGRAGAGDARAGARVGAAVHSLRAVDPAAASVVAGWARERSAPLHAHVSEQPAENEAALDAYGETPTEVLAGAGALSDRFTAVHATHVSEHDIALLGGAGAFCCLCPTTERDLADGIGPAARLRDAGARLALGSDSNAVVEPFEEARAVELDERLSSGVRGLHRGDELLQDASSSGYASLGWPEGGAIREGALADLVAVRLDGVRLAGVAREDVVDAVVFAGAAADVGDVVVGGRLIVRDGAHVTRDVPRELAAAISEIST